MVACSPARDAVCMFAVVQQLMVVLAGLGFVCLVTAIFVVLGNAATRERLGQKPSRSRASSSQTT